MGIEVAPVADEGEFRQFGLVTTRAFGDQLDDDVLDEERSVVTFERLLLARDGRRPVGTAGAYDFELTLPGARTLAVPGVTAVAVSPTHRRRGILTELMRAQLDGFAETGHQFAMLTASESGIYRRFGYGPATEVRSFDLDKDRSAFDHPPAAPGVTELWSKDEAAPAVPAIYDRYRRRRPGMLSRSEAWWAVLLGDRKSWKGGGAFFVAVHVGEDGPDGYAFYVVEKNVDEGLWRGRVVVRELLGDTPDVEAALWRFCLDLDLCTRLRGLHRPVDEPLRWRLADPRQFVHQGPWDMLWLRPVDVAGAVTARGYEHSGSLTLGVVDAFLPANEGTYRLVLDPDGSSCDRTGAAADLVLDVSDLGSALLGGTSLVRLAAAGRVAEHRSGAAAELDRLLGTTTAPYCNTEF